MGSYGGVTFGTRVESGVLVNEFAAEENSTSTHISGSNADDVQFGGRSNQAVTWTLRFASLADYSTFRALQGSTLRTLTKYDSTTVTNVMLRRCGPPQRHPGSSKVFAEAVFEVGT